MLVILYIYFHQQILVDCSLSWGRITPIFCLRYSKLSLGRGLVNMSAIFSFVGMYSNLTISLTQKEVHTILIQKKYKQN